jgi:hypothetical protein
LLIVSAKLFVVEPAAELVTLNNGTIFVTNGLF